MGSTRAFQAEGLAPTHSCCWEKTWDVQESRASALLGPMKQIMEDMAGATGRDQTLAFTLQTAESQGRDLRMPAHKPVSPQTAVPCLGAHVRACRVAGHSQCSQANRGGEIRNGLTKAPPPPGNLLRFANLPQPLAITTWYLKLYYPWQAFICRTRFLPGPPTSEAEPRESTVMTGRNTPN